MVDHHFSGQKWSVLHGFLGNHGQPGTSAGSVVVPTLGWESPRKLGWLGAGLGLIYHGPDKANSQMTSKKIGITNSSPHS